MKDLKYRMVAGPEFAPLAKVMEEMGEPIPNPILSVGFVAEDEYGNIVAHVVIQSVPFAEPTHAEPGFGEALGPLFQMAQDFILKSGAPRVIMHTSHPAMKRMISRVKPEPMVSTDQWYDWRKPEPLEKAG